jgi:hypothetical protein
MAVRQKGAIKPVRRREDRGPTGSVIDYWVETRGDTEFHTLVFASGHTQIIATKEPVKIIGPKES